MVKPVLECFGVVKHYRQGPQTIEVLTGVDLQLFAGEHIAIVGSSGSGKSTLLNVLGGLDKPDKGRVDLLAQPFSSCSDNQRGRIRNQSLGFVYQFHHLLPEFSAVENVAMPLLIAGVKRSQALLSAEQMLTKVGLLQRVSHKPSELSGGERQRVAIARAIVNQPACVLMDEPTGNLDEKNAESIQALMKSLSREVSTSFVVVTHDNKLAATMDKTYHLSEGGLHLKGGEPDGL
ncbi:ABC transporter ATP-binding protein [Teredinibacter waterburyi]|jgi:ABC-type antimicrobial peptide transport system, ATPase component|uniref:ABC transporter ATP-binding protein n=1 Tax=Teredinibacter waterburyi TaxID=1500538 RepID=UPI00165EE817|nr:ATP-binding cassette domain-containing protein [Teredinibacter waterburyi]